MNYRWTGAMLIFLACGGFGFSAAASVRREANTLRQLLRLVEQAQCELSYRLTPLPELCRLLARSVGGVLRDVLQALSRELEQQIYPDVPSCMSCVLAQRKLPAKLRRLLTRLGESLGQYDLSGQLKQLESLQQTCRRELEKLEQDRDTRIRSYQTLGLCAGAALVILFI